MNQGFRVLPGTNHHHFMHTVSGISAGERTVWRGTGSAADSAALRQELLHPLRSPSTISIAWSMHPDSADLPVRQLPGKTMTIKIERGDGI